jgi:predicted transcriptional regulator YheO
MTDRAWLARRLRRHRAELRRREREIGRLARQLADLQLKDVRHRGKLLTELKHKWIAMHVLRLPGPLKAAVEDVARLLELSRATVYKAVRPYLDSWKR